jgi:hypothetical protein
MQLLFLRRMVFSQTTIFLAIAGVFWGAGLRTIGTNNALKLTNMCSQEPRLSTEDKHAMDGTTINFHLYPNKFVKELTDCFNDADCRIYYYHFEKSGGTDVENRMALIFPPRLQSCCGETQMQRFRDAPNEFCKAKFSSYQVGSSDFLDEIVPTCIAKTGARAVVLVSFREPIQRTLSYIHQKCNKHFRVRSDSMKMACRRCSYEQDKVFWDDLVQHANSQYLELLDVASAQISNTTVLSVDSMDLSALYRDLFAASGHATFNMSVRSNPEKTTRCNFGFKSEMFRGLRLSAEVYRNMSGWQSL